MNSKFKNKTFFMHFCQAINNTETSTGRVNSFIHLRRRYGTVKTTRRVEKLDLKYRKAKLDLELLLSCRDNDLTPKFVTFHVSNLLLHNTAGYQSC